MPYTLELDGATRRLDAMLVAVGNGPSFGGGLRITEGALFDDGMLDVVIIKPMSKPDLIRTYPKLFNGTHIHHPPYEHHRVREVTVAAPGIVAYADGERFGALPLTITCAPESLTVIAEAHPDKPLAALALAGTPHEHPSRPSERYAEFRRGQEHPVFTEFTGLYDFALDDFQVRACHEVEEGRRRTGRGADRLRQDHRRRVRGAPGPAAGPQVLLHDADQGAVATRSSTTWCRRYGPDKVGLLTGDNTVNGEAPIVVMTTEVLRNMLYAGSRTLMGLGFVVMDEVHYLADRMRGAVWEEVIIHLPESVSVISLSATVSNAEEFGEWLATVRGDTTTIVEEVRPVPLFQHVMVGKRLLRPLRRRGGPGPGRLRPGGRQGQPAAAEGRARRLGGHPVQGPAGRRGSAAADTGPRAAVRTCPRASTSSTGSTPSGLLPAIDFIFSRVGCDAAVTQCLQRQPPADHAGGARRDLRVRRGALPHLPDDDLHVLGYHDFLDGLTRGVAAHHAGMLPTFKECVEELFSAACAASCSPPRRWPSASTCRRGRS